MTELERYIEELEWFDALREAIEDGHIEDAIASIRSAMARLRHLRDMERKMQSQDDTQYFEPQLSRAWRAGEITRGLDEQPTPEHSRLDETLRRYMAREEQRITKGA